MITVDFLKPFYKAHPFLMGEKGGTLLLSRKKEENQLFCVASAPRVLPVYCV